MTKVVWAKTAKKDLVSIVDYIAQDSKQNALKVLRKIKRQVATLQDTPEKCRVVAELNEQGVTQYRDMVIAPWRVIYRVTASEVLILAVLDSRRNIEDILLKRLTGGYFK